MLARLSGMLGAAQVLVGAIEGDQILACKCGFKTTSLACSTCGKNAKFHLITHSESAVPEEAAHVPDELLVLDNISPSEQIFMTLFEKQQSCFWSWNELKFNEDATDLQKLLPKERQLFEYILAFFATADGEVLENAVVNFLSGSKCLPVRMAYTAQVMFESIHIKTYFTALTVYIPDATERYKLSMAFKTDPLIKERDDWMTHYIAQQPGANQDLVMAKRLIAFACAEGLFFMSAFMVIGWLRSRGLFPVFAQANESIARDEWIHVNLGIEYFKYLFDSKKAQIGLSNADILGIVQEAVELECKFATTLVPTSADADRFDGLRSEELVLHIRNLGNKILVLLGLPENWKLDLSKQPPWYKWIEIQSKANFYERGVVNYTTPTACSEDPKRDEDF